MGIVFGKDAKLYRNTGTWADPTWNEVGNVRDLTSSLEKNEADVTVRASGSWRQIAAVLKTASVDFGMIYDTDDEDFTVFQEAWNSDSQVLVDCAVMDGDITVAGAQGLRAEMTVLNFSRTENLEEALTVPVVLKPGFSSNNPYWMTVTT